MKRVLFFITVIYLMLPLCANAIINPEYKKEVINWCPSSEERNDRNQEMLFKKYNCIGASKNYFPREYFNVAHDFAKKLKYIYRTKDINALANIAPYPNVYIYNYKNKKFIEVKSKQQLLKLDKNILLSRNIFKRINESYLNWYWAGFLFNQGEIMFFVENNKVTMLAISLK